MIKGVNLYISFKQVSDDCRMKVMNFIMDCPKGIIGIHPDFSMNRCGGLPMYSFQVIFNGGISEWPKIENLARKLIKIKKEY
jgi:hypothetical protein